MSRAYVKSSGSVSLVTWQLMLVNGGRGRKGDGWRRTACSPPSLVGWAGLVVGAGLPGLSQAQKVA